MITSADEAGDHAGPRRAAWKPGTGQDGAVEEDKDVAEITRPDEPAREMARRAALDRPPEPKPSRRQMAEPDRL